MSNDTRGIENLSKSGDSLDIRVQKATELNIKVISQSDTREVLDINVIKVSESSGFRRFIGNISEMFKDLFQTREVLLPIRVINETDSTGLDVIPVSAVDLNLANPQLPISVLRAYISLARLTYPESWGGTNTQAKREAFAKAGDSSFDLPIRVIPESSPQPPTSPRGDLEIIVHSSQEEAIEEVSFVKYDQDWVRSQVTLLKNTYGQEIVNTPIVFMQHHEQKYKFIGPQYQGRKVSSCLMASVYNALDALQLRKGESEDDLILEVGSAFNTSGGMVPFKALEIFAKRSIPAYPTDSLLEIARVLELGGVVLVTGGNHARLVSGMQSDGAGNIHFRLNDPLRKDVSLATPEELASIIADGINEVARSRGLTRARISGVTSTLAIQPNLAIRVLNN